MAGNARPTRIRIGSAVHRISSLVLWVNSVSGTAPFDLRNLNIAMAIAPNTITPITTQIHSVIMCAS